MLKRFAMKLLERLYTRIRLGPCRVATHSIRSVEYKVFRRVTGYRFWSVGVTYIYLDGKYCGWGYGGAEYRSPYLAKKYWKVKKYFHRDGMPLWNFLKWKITGDSGMLKIHEKAVRASINA